MQCCGPLRSASAQCERGQLESAYEARACSEEDVRMCMCSCCRVPRRSMLSSAGFASAHHLLPHKRHVSLSCLRGVQPNRLCVCVCVRGFHRQVLQAPTHLLPHKRHVSFSCLRGMAKPSSCMYAWLSSASSASTHHLLPHKRHVSPRYLRGMANPP